MVFHFANRPELDEHIQTLHDSFLFESIVEIAASMATQEHRLSEQELVSTLVDCVAAKAALQPDWNAEPTHGEPLAAAETAGAAAILARGANSHDPRPPEDIPVPSDSDEDLASVAPAAHPSADTRSVGSEPIDGELLTDAEDMAATLALEAGSRQRFLPQDIPVPDSSVGEPSDEDAEVASTVTYETDMTFKAK